MPTHSDKWPTWIAPNSTRETEDTGYGGISRYVVPELLDELSARQFASGKWAGFVQSDDNQAEAKRAIVDHLWTDLVNQSISYAAPPWNPGVGQRIRHPAWLLRRDASGTCLDLATFFAGACLNQEFETFLVMRRHGDSGHAAVAVRVSGALGSLPMGCERGPGEGVLRVVQPDALCHDESLLLLDVAVGTAGTPDQSRQAAVESLVADLTVPGAESHLVNIAQRHLAGDDPLGFQPTYQGALITRLEPTPSDHFDLTTRDEVRARLARSNGKVVVQGETGVGKSTVALEAALMADEGFGWFLSGANKTAYEASLARHEMAERGRVFDAIDADLQGTLAREALKRLADNEGSWVVVIDNADAGPAGLGSLPDPGPEQLVIFTSTAAPEVWDGYQIEPLEPFSDGDMANAVRGFQMDDRLVAAIEGRPLLLRAFRSLTKNFPSAIDGLAEARPLQSSGEVPQGK